MSSFFSFSRDNVVPASSLTPLEPQPPSNAKQGMPPFFPSQLVLKPPTLTPHLHPFPVTSYCEKETISACECISPNTHLPCCTLLQKYITSIETPGILSYSRVLLSSLSLATLLSPPRATANRMTKKKGQTPVFEFVVCVLF